jgi:hypothetical protein
MDKYTQPSEQFSEPCQEAQNFTLTLLTNLKVLPVLIFCKGSSSYVHLLISCHSSSLSIEL